MTEEKKSTEESTSAEASADKEVIAPAAVEEVEVATESKKDEDAGKPEELPEELKKKLEKQKASRTPLKGKRKKKGDKKRVSSGKAFVRSTYNNTVITLTDNDGNVLSWANAGLAGFKGPKKATPYAAQIITRIAVDKAKEEYGLSEVKVFVKGVGTGRESAVRALNANGLVITYIKDITPLPHNGCRARKPRRV